MSQALAHRGPDAGAVWTDGEAGIGLGHRRLSILDLSPAGAQPMSSPSGRYVIAYNGEIYNHMELRRTLEQTGAAPVWRGHSDTETLLSAIDEWGLADTLGSISGMFAFALWDRRHRQLTLARDRLGEKPLYYGSWRDSLLFASELKALEVFPGFDPSLDQIGLAAFIRHGYVPEPLSIYAEIGKVQPGCTVNFSSPRDRSGPQAYWRVADFIRHRGADESEAPYPKLCSQVENTLSEVVESQMLSDVPIGAFLSGGIDSSLTVALMQRLGGQVRTFSIGFASARYNEADHARQVANHLGTRHTEFVVTEADALAVVPDLPHIYDEPFADSSQIPTILLSRLARHEVTVALTGDGGDEVFGGYNRHLLLPSAWRRLKHIPPVGRRALGCCVAAIQGVGAAESEMLRTLPRTLGLPMTTFEKLGRIGGAIRVAQDFPSFYGAIADVFPNLAEILCESSESHPLPELPSDMDLTDWAMAMDTLTYLPGDILVKVDRAAMSASLETRTPFLDRRVVESAWELPRTTKVCGRVGKRILRDILSQHVPIELFSRPKQGFSIPLDQWLRGDLRDWAETLLDPKRIRPMGFLSEQAVGRIWNAHRVGKRNYGHQLWTILMLQTWLTRSASVSAKAATAALPA